MNGFGKHYVYAILTAIPVWIIWEGGETGFLHAGKGMHVEAATEPERHTVRLALYFGLLVAVVCAWLPEIVADLRRTDWRDWFR